jgi:hypothetical protein
MKGTVQNGISGWASGPFGVQLLLKPVACSSQRYSIGVNNFKYSCQTYIFIAMNSAVRIALSVVVFFSSLCIKAQTTDTLYLMNGNVIGEKVMDTLLGAVTIADSKKPGKKLHYEWDQLYMIRYANGMQRYYYQQDSTKYNWFTRDEMWYFTKGERDSRRGFKPVGCAIGAGVAGLLGGMSGTFWGPVLPYGWMAFSGITRIKIKQRTVSDARYVDYDAYILGYERTARQKRKIWSVLSGTAGLVLGYSIYGIFHDKYPETLQIKFLSISL